jgi:hypothetical protein
MQPKWQAQVTITVEFVEGAPAGPRRKLLIGLAGVTVLAVVSGGSRGTR